MPVHVVSTYSTTSSRVGVNSGFKLLLALFVADGIPDIVRTHHDSEGTLNGVFSYLRHNVDRLNLTAADPVRYWRSLILLLSLSWLVGDDDVDDADVVVAVMVMGDGSVSLADSMVDDLLFVSTIFQVPSSSEQERDEIKAQVVAAFGETTRSNRNQPIAKQFYEMALTANPTAVQVFHRQCWDRLPIKVRERTCRCFSFSHYFCFSFSPSGPT